MPHPDATFIWATPDGHLVQSEHEPFIFVGANTFVSQCIINTNLSAFPPEIQPYRVTASAGEHSKSLDFHVCSSVDAVIYRENFARHASGQLPDDWTVVSAGYGLGAQWIENLVFENHNHVLRMTSYEERSVTLTHPLNISKDHVELSFRVRLWEEAPYEHQNNEALILGFYTQSDSFNILRLGRSDRQEVLPFGTTYTQNEWIQFEIYLDMDPLASSASIYMNGIRLGSRRLPPANPGDIEGLIITLGDGAYYVGQFDDIVLREYDLEEGIPDHPAVAEINVRPSHGQWFDPSSLITVFSVNVTPCLMTNPYIIVEGLKFQLWNSTHILGEFGGTSWNGTEYCNSPCRVFRYDFTKKIPVDLFQGQGEYRVISQPVDPTLTNLVHSFTFNIDDPIDAYFSVLEAGPPIHPPVFDLANTYNLSICVEFDPSPTNGGNENFTERDCLISWLDPEGEIIKNQSARMATKISYPTGNSWIFGSLQLQDYFAGGTYGASISALCNSGYPILDTYNFTVIGIGEPMASFIVTILLPSFLLAHARGRSLSGRE